MAEILGDGFGAGVYTPSRDKDEGPHAHTPKEVLDTLPPLSDRTQDHSLRIKTHLERISLGVKAEEVALKLKGER